MGKEIHMHKLGKEIEQALSKRGIRPETVEVWNDLNGPFDLYVEGSYKWLAKHRKHISEIVSKYGFSYKGIFRLMGNQGWFLAYEKWKQEAK